MEGGRYPLPALESWAIAERTNCNNLHVDVCVDTA